MKNLFVGLFSFFIIAAGFTACNDDDNGSNPGSDSTTSGCFIFSYGLSNDGGNASIYQYDYENDSLISNVYKSKNKLELNLNLEGVCEYDQSVYLVGNSSDQLITLDKNLIQNYNGVTDSIANPRECVGNGDYVYVSCWGSNPDYGAMAGSYIAVYNIKNMQVERKISLPGGPEGVEVADGKLYAGLNYKDSIAVINLSDYAISYIPTPAVCSSMLKDNSGNLYVAMVSTYSDPSDDAGLGYVNTSTDKLTTYALANVSSEYADIMAINATGTRLYLIAASYDENYHLSGAVRVFDTENQSFEATPLISDITAPEGVGVNPDNDDVYLLTAPTTSTNGYLTVYSSAGVQQKQYKVGIYPTRMIFK